MLPYQFVSQSPYKFFTEYSSHHHHRATLYGPHLCSDTIHGLLQQLYQYELNRSISVVRTVELTHIKTKKIVKLCNKDTLAWEGPSYPRNGTPMGTSLLALAHLVMKCHNTGKSKAKYATMPCHHMAAMAVNGLELCINANITIYQVISVREAGP